VAAGFYKLAKLMEYETVNPGQDASAVSSPRLSAEDPDSHLDHKPILDLEGGRSDRGLGRATA
jgi:hypothetical protein